MGYYASDPSPVHYILLGSWLGLGRLALLVGAMAMEECGFHVDRDGIMNEMVDVEAVTERTFKGTAYAVILWTGHSDGRLYVRHHMTHCIYNFSHGRVSDGRDLTGLDGT